MKRVGNLFSEFVSFSNLYFAWRRARRGARKNLESGDFTFHLEGRLLDLKERLESGLWAPKPYRYFEIFDPKHRTISVAAFEDRVVHHALVNVLEPIFERCFIPDSYATRKGKGTHAAVLRAQAMIRRADWFFKSDVEKYFDSIDHEIMLTLIQRKIKDGRLLEVVAKIIRNGGRQGRGLPIGNLTSQFFANVYLDPLDHFVKDYLGVKQYIRYMDDFVFFHEDKDKLKMWRYAVAEFLEDKLRLSLKSSATYLNSAQNGLSFLGTRVFPGIIRLRPANCRRMLRRLHLREQAWTRGELDEDTFLASVNSYWALLAFYPTDGLRRRLLAY